jgi:DNA invertase Pin-like site-specific DNA recombinase
MFRSEPPQINPVGPFRLHLVLRPQVIVGKAANSPPVSLLGLGLFHMFGALAEFERNLARERTQAGLNAARARGRKGGRPKVLDPAKRKFVAKLYAEKQHTISEICRMMGISKPTLYNYIAEANA